MHGFSSGSTCLVNSEVDSMGGVVDNGVGFGSKPSPRRVAIEKAQIELRHEYDVLEERRRELEFLEKGGNPLDFKFDFGASMSVQSTSRTYQHPDQFLTSEAKGSFALPASPHGDSVESSGRLGVTTVCEPNSADNFDGENELLKGERKFIHRGRGSITPLVHASQIGRSQTVKELEDSPVVNPKKGQAYRRRNRSRPSRGGPRSSSIDGASHVGHGSCMPNRQTMVSKSFVHENQSEVESDGTHALHLSASSRANEFPEGKQDTSTSKDKQEETRCVGVKSEEAPIATSSLELNLVAEQENVVPVNDECPPCSDVEHSKNDVICADSKESGKINGNRKRTSTECLLSNIRQATKGLDSESFCTQNSRSVDGNGNIDNEISLNLRDVDGNAPPEEHKLSLGENSISQDEKMCNEKHTSSAMEDSSCNGDQNALAHQPNGEEFDRGKSPPGDEAKCPSDVRCQEIINHTETKSDGQTGPLVDSIPKMESAFLVRMPSSVDCTFHETNRTSPPVSLPHTCIENQQKVVDKAHEEMILEEARIIQAKRQRFAESSGVLLTSEYRKKSHWDFVIEEMAWLANDFAQERLWKMTAAAQICRQISFASRLRLEEKNKCCKKKSVAHKLAKAVMEFWYSAGLLVRDADSSLSEKGLDGAKADDVGVAGCMVGGTDKDNGPDQELQSREQKRDLAVNRYAVRFLQFNRSFMASVIVEVPGSPRIEPAFYVPEISGQEQFKEENLNYAVPPGAIDTYRRSVESCLVKSQRMDYNIQEEVDTSMYDIPAGVVYQDNNYEEDEGENVYYLPRSFGTGKPLKQKRKNMKSYGARSYDSGGAFDNGQCRENRNGPPRSILVGKRPSNSLHVGSIPTKRMRTASRQRVVGFLNAGSAVGSPVPNRPDASSGDTNSFQDDQSTLHGGSSIPRSFEANSAVDFEKQSPFDSTEKFTKPKKKKQKIKHKGTSYDQRWPHDSPVKNEQKFHLRNRQDGYQLESNVNGLFGHNAKKLKLTKKSLDSSLDNITPIGGSLASPVASQMSNMFNQSKIIKLIGGRGRKAKALKVPAGQPGSGIPWTLFEDQALVVLVHDMGPNWELVSDAMNSTLQFKCIFRKPLECKERHNILMDRTTGDGADSADDSGSSQPYPSTLPGIPKGSARQLFQRLQGPMEEDTIKSQFEKIILIGQQLVYRIKQDMKQIVHVHGSHVVALSQVIPNSVNGVTLTPLDLCEVSPPSDDLLPLGFQGQHAGGLPLPNQGTLPPVHSLGVNSPLQTSSSMGVGSNLASPSSQFHSSGEARNPVLGSASLSTEEQQRMRQYNQMLHGRNIQPSNLISGVPSGSDRGVGVLPARKGVEVMSVSNKSMQLPRPGLQGCTSSSMLNSGIASGAAPGQANSVFRPRDSLNMPGQSSDHQRQMKVPEIQIQGTRSNNQGGPPFGDINSGFTNQTAFPPPQTYPSHHHQQQHSHVSGSGPHHKQLTGLGSSHSGSSEQQALLRLTRERQMQQKMLQRKQQRQQLLSSRALMTHVQTAPEPSLQSSSQLQSQAASQPAPLPPLSPSSSMTQVSSQPCQQQVPPQGPVKSGHSGMMIGRQRQRQAQQQCQQAGSQHTLQRPQAQQQAKILKGIGNNMTMNQNLPMDPSHPNGLSANLNPQVPEKGEQGEQDQGLSPVSGGLKHPSRPLASPQISGHSQPQKPYVNNIPAMPKQVQQTPSRVMPPINRQHLHGESQLPINSMNQSHPAHKRAIQQSHTVNADALNQLQSDQSLFAQQFASNSTTSMSSSFTNTAARKASESPCDSGMLSSPSSSGPVSSPGITNSSGNNEGLSSISEGLRKKQLLANLVPQGYSSESQWEQEQSTLEQSHHSLQPLSQKQSRHQLQQLEQSSQRVPQ